jgi:hypothetical protein
MRGWGRIDWNSLAQERNKWSVLEKAVMNFQVP